MYSIIDSSVVFPDPDGPRKVRNSPLSISRDTWSTAGRTRPGKRLVTLVIRMRPWFMLSRWSAGAPGRSPWRLPVV